MSTDAITQAAHDQMERHSERTTTQDYPYAKGLTTSYTGCTCGKPCPCPDRVAAERVVQLAADVAATHEKIRAALSLVKHHADKGSYNGRPLDALESIHFQAEAILGLLEPAEHTPFREPYSGHTADCSLGAHHTGPCEPSEHTPARNYPANPYDDGVDLYEESPDA